MSPPDSLDLPRVEAWMAQHVPGFKGPLTAQKMPGGQSNPTFRLTAPSGVMVLRRKPPGELLKSAHAVDREYRVQRALAGTAVPVARMIALCEREDVTGTIFYVMEHIEGRVFDDPSLPAETPAGRTAIYRELARVLAAIHTVDIAAVGLGDFGRPGHYYERQLARWTRQYEASALAPLPQMHRLIDWLGANMPPDDGTPTLVHGDVRIDNLIIAPHGPECRAVIDWELSTLGHPLADVAALIMQWRMPAGTGGRGLDGVDRTALGLPSDAAFLSAYFESVGRPPPPSMGFYLAFAFFRMAAILEGVKRRGIDGNASDPARAAELGAMVPVYVAKGLEARDG